MPDDAGSPPPLLVPPSSFVPSRADVEPEPEAQPVAEFIVLPPVAAVVEVPAAAAVWRLDLPFGQASVVLGGVTAIGRNPSTVEGHPDATLVSVADPAKSVSKTHALVEPDSATVWVTDLASTNGVGAVASDDEISVLEPGVRTRVASGTRLMLGEFAITVVFG